MNVKDCLDILELIVRYAHSYDSNDIEEPVSFFTDDARANTPLSDS